jgi:hypothetical protein
MDELEGVLLRDGIARQGRDLPEQVVDDRILLAGQVARQVLAVVEREGQGPGAGLALETDPVECPSQEGIDGRARLS